jgi:hypothetical protein
MTLCRIVIWHIDFWPRVIACNKSLSKLYPATNVDPSPHAERARSRPRSRPRSRSAPAPIHLLKMRKQDI